jgi:hypothetical protein
MNPKVNRIMVNIYIYIFLCITTGTKLYELENGIMHLSSLGIRILKLKVQTITSKIELPYKVKVSRG